jgi:drug/metabolite transporter (DMT)-like permease
MAQTRKKRRSKHRGTAAGSVVVRGRTGRKPTADERKAASKSSGRTPRANRHDKPPTWKGALGRSAVATVFFVVLSVLLLDTPPAQSISLAAFVLVLYTGLGYGIDMMFHKRRLRKLGKAPS